MLLPDDIGQLPGAIGAVKGQGHISTLVAAADTDETRLATTLRRGDQNGGRVRIAPRPPMIWRRIGDLNP